MSFKYRVSRQIGPDKQSDFRTLSKPFLKQVKYQGKITFLNYVSEMKKQKEYNIGPESFKK